jgi:SAM-dependent methyltransferase
MSKYSYGQREPMENDAMVRTLDAQARAIWPQEKQYLQQIFTSSGLDVIDVGCGTGEISARLVKEFSPKNVVGLDLSEVNLLRARERYSQKEYPGLVFQQGNAMQMDVESSRFDVAVCRHMLQAVPEPLRVIKEMIRVTKLNGRLYFLAEDYGMIFLHPTTFDADEFWREYVWKAGTVSGSNLHQGRTMPSVLASLKCSDIQMKYLCVDTLRVERNLLADIFTHWRDGFEQWISTHSGHSLEDVRRRFDDIIEATRRNDGYAVWLIPSVLARVTSAAKKICSENYSG